MTARVVIYVRQIAGTRPFSSNSSARGSPMCFHIGPEFVEALTSRAADNSAVDKSAVVSDGMHPSEGQEHLTAIEHLASRLRAFPLAGVTSKWLLFILWVCL